MLPKNIRSMLKILLLTFTITFEEVQSARDFMEFNNNEVRKVIKHVSTRWLSLGKCLERTLMQWDSLESYFLSYFDLQDDLKDTEDEKYNREKRFSNAFTNLITKLYSMFAQSIIPIFDSFNTFLQSEQPLIHVLNQSTMRLYRSLLSRFVLPEVISSSKNILSIDLDDPKLLKNDHQIFIGTLHEVWISLTLLSIRNF